MGHNEREESWGTNSREIVDTIFNQMDSWRHLPDYQLERRTDIYFSLYLVEALDKYLEIKVKQVLIPEFPLRLGTLYPDKQHERPNLSKKVDFLAVTQKGDEVILIELKTDIYSRKPKQDEYLAQTREIGMLKLLQDLQLICVATKAKNKYLYLLKELMKIGIIEIRNDDGNILTIEKMTKENIGMFMRNLSIIPVKVEDKPRIVYIQPIGNGNNVINFEQIQVVASNHNDEVSKRFVESIEKWKRNPKDIEH